MKIVLELKNKPVKGDILVVDTDSTVEAVSQYTLFKSLTDRIKDLEDSLSDLTERVAILEDKVAILEGVEE